MTEASSAKEVSRRAWLARRWNDFFFAEEPVYPAVYFRAFLASWTVAFFLPRLPHLRELYTERVIHVPHPLMAPLGSVPELPLWAVWILVLGLLAGSIAFAFGWHARKLHGLIILLLCYLLGFDVSTVRGYGALAFYQWLVCICLPYDRLRDESGVVLCAPRWGLRLAMLLFSSVYVFSVLAKAIGGEGWFDGKTLFYTLRGHDYGSFLVSAWFPVSLGVARILGWATLAGECFIGFGLWHRRTRFLAVLACVGMHTAMALTMRVSVLFHLLMLGHLPLFLAPRAWERVWISAPRRTRP